MYKSTVRPIRTIGSARATLQSHTAKFRSFEKNFKDETQIKRKSLKKRDIEIKKELHFFILTSDMGFQIQPRTSLIADLFDFSLHCAGR